MLNSLSSYINTLSENSVINIIYTLILMALLSGGLIFHIRHNRTKTLKHLAIWGLLICLLILLYSYRYDYYNFKERFLGELLPNRPTTQKDGSITLRLSQDGHYYINIYINNQKIRFMIDTGASDIVLSKQDAKKLGLNTSSLKYSKPYNTANGISYGAAITLNQINIAEFTLKNIPASVNSGKMENSLLGMSFLNQLSGYSVKDNILTLYP
jgi:aspartyl protease family protein